MTAPLPDAAPANWVDRFAPEGLKPWLKLGRFDRPVGIWLLMLPGWWGVALACAQGGRWPDPRLLLLIAVGAAVMRAAGCAYNDIVDRDLDRQVARTAGRPVASGRISVRAAWAYVVGLSLVGLVILLQLSLLAVLIGAASLLLVAAYPFMKRITWWPQLWLGLTFNWGVLVGFAAVDGRGRAAAHEALATGYLERYLDGPCHLYPYCQSVTTVWAPAVVLYLSGVLWTLGYDTIYALQDLEDDALAGVKSSARRLGARTRVGVAGFYATAALLALVVGGAAKLGPSWWSDSTWALGPLWFLGWAGFTGQLAWQAWRVQVDDPRLALRLFKSNVWAGLTLFAALALGTLQLSTLRDLPLILSL